jgi:HEAT repeat protein
VDGARGLELVAMAVALGPKHADAVHRAALASKDSAVRRVALEALPREEVAQLRELLEPIVLDDAADLRRTAGDLLLSVRHEGLVPLLAQLLNRPDVDEASASGLPASAAWEGRWRR